MQQCNKAAYSVFDHLFRKTTTTTKNSAKNPMSLIEVVYDLCFVFSVQSKRQIEIKSTDLVGWVRCDFFSHIKCDETKYSY